MNIQFRFAASFLLLFAFFSPGNSQSFFWGDRMPDVSPDGKKILFSTYREGNTSRIYMMNADGSDQQRINYRDIGGNHTDVNWSPDKRSIVFNAPNSSTFTNSSGGGGGIFMMKADGSGLRLVVDNKGGDVGFGSWADNKGRRFYFSGTFEQGKTENVYVINSNGTGLKQLTFSEKNNHVSPILSPDGKKIYFWHIHESGTISTSTMNPDGSNIQLLTKEEDNFYITDISPDGKKLLCSSNRDRDFEIYMLDADGSNPVRMTNSSGMDGGAKFSPDGKYIYWGSRRTGNYSLYRMDIDGGNKVNLTRKSATHNYAAMNEAMDKVVYTSNIEGNENVYMADVDGSNVQQLTDDPASDREALFLPKTNKILFVSGRRGFNDIYTMNLDGTGIKNLTQRDGEDSQPSVSADGTKISFVSDRDGNIDIYVMDVDGSNVQRITSHAGYDAYPRISPDGTKVVWLTNRDGNFEVYRADIDGTNQTNLTKNDARDMEASWLGNDQILFTTARFEQGRFTYRLATMNVDGTNVRRIDFSEGADRRSRDPFGAVDGEKVLFSSNHGEDKNYHIYMLNLTNGQVTQVSRID